MNKYVPAIKIESHGKITYQTSFSCQAFDSYQDALNDATEKTIRKREEPRITRPDGFVFPAPKCTPVVLKEVKLKEMSDD